MILFSAHLLLFIIVIMVKSTKGQHLDPISQEVRHTTALSTPATSLRWGSDLKQRREDITLVGRVSGEIG